jgi:D-lactate dehydrogenase (cytochrome)
MARMSQLFYDSIDPYRYYVSPEDRRNLWRARHDVVYADKALRERGQLWVSDVCVPISRLAECITQTQKDLSSPFLPAPIVGHAGDGNFHVGFVLDANSALPRRDQFTIAGQG